jgi:serine/threonine protein kinase
VERTSAQKVLAEEFLPPGAQPLQADDPEVIGGHRLTARLASGGTSIIYLARDPAGGPVVVKTTGAPDETQARRRLRTEAASIRRLPTFCTARLLADGTDHSPPYLISEYIKGPSLTQFVEDMGPLVSEQLAAVAFALARALAAIHGAGLIHCDLRPDNILLSADGPQVIDFSIAQETPIAGRPADIGTVPYSPGWVAPERLDGYPAGPASDVFGWGCLVGYAATGRSPFDDDVTGEPGRWSVARASALASLEQPLRGLVEAALAVDPADRPTTGEITTRLGDADGGAEEPDSHRRRTDVPPRPSAPSLDPPTAPMPTIEREPDPAAAGLPEVLPPATVQALRESGALPMIDLADDPAGEIDEIVPWQPTEPVVASDMGPRRVDDSPAVVRRPAEADPGAGAPPRRVEYSAVLAGSRLHTEEDAGSTRRSRRLRTVVMISASVALVAVLATVIVMAGSEPREGQPAGNGGAVVPAQPPVDSPAPAVVPHRRSHRARSRSTSGAGADAVIPSPARSRRHDGNPPRTPTHSSHSRPPGSTPVSSPTPTPTHTPSPTPTPTATGTVPAT